MHLVNEFEPYIVCDFPGRELEHLQAPSYRWISSIRTFNAIRRRVLRSNIFLVSMKSKLRSQKHQKISNRACWACTRTYRGWKWCGITKRAIWWSQFIGIFSKYARKTIWSFCNVAEKSFWTKLARAFRLLVDNETTGHITRPTPFILWFKIQRTRGTTAISRGIICKL